MSLHVPRGLLLTGPAANPFALSAHLWTVLRQRVRAEVVSKVAGDMATHVDAARAGFTASTSIELEGPRTLAAVTAAVVDKVAEAAISMRRSPEWDLSVSVKILAHPRDPGLLLGIVSAEQGWLRDLVLAAPGVREYRYYSVEHPPVGEDEWADRARVWAAALRDGLWSDLGWEWSLLDPEPAVTLTRLVGRVQPEEVVAALPADADRAQVLAQYMLAGNGPAFDPADVMGSLRAWAAARDALAPSALARLAPITAADLPSGR